ncbi:MAG: hypothetical protein KC589_02790 [Nanoarchaeota archaeon]|nr:hypothetical protein [Nanoarchaeota archaeon]
MNKNIFFVFFGLCLLFVSCSSNEESNIEISPEVFCEVKSDCELVNFDCSDCSCDEIFPMNKDYVEGVCKDSKVEVQCDMICEAKEFDCIENQCALVE